MSRILVPIDHSHVAESAANYAVQLASIIDAEITLIHVINASLSAVDNYFIDSIDEVFNVSNKKLQQFADELAEKFNNKVAIQIEVKFGVPGFAIADYANANKVDYIVTGMRDRHNLIERLLGTTSTIITKMAQCPVLLIHENTYWRRPEKVIFTLDDSSDFDESIHKYLVFNRTFSAKTDFIHIRSEDEATQSPSNVVLQEMFMEKVPEFAFEIKTIYGGDIVQSIVDYSIFEKADLLVMVHRKRSILDGFFNKSLTLKTAEGFHLPIMVLEESIILDK